ncbi:MAG: methionine biosynthesis protein MetW [Dehalococcoidia bacterium]
MRSPSKLREYLFKDFDYVAPFGAGMDYEAYWAARSKQESELEDAMYAYKFQLIARLVEPGSSVLDIGCGDGSLLAHLRDTRAVKAYGAELSEKACAMARQKGIEVVQADVSLEGTELPQVDYIVMSEVLEHLPNPEDVLLRLKGKFNKRLLVDIPNTGAVNDRLRLLLGRFPKQWVFHAGEHIRFWTITDFLSVCDQLDYDVERYYGLYDPYYQFGLKLWRLYPRLFARYVLYILGSKP